MPGPFSADDLSNNLYLLAALQNVQQLAPPGANVAPIGANTAASQALSALGGGPQWQPHRGAAPFWYAPTSFTPPPPTSHSMAGAGAPPPGGSAIPAGAWSPQSLDGGQGSLAQQLRQMMQTETGKAGLMQFMNALNPSSDAT